MKVYLLYCLYVAGESYDSASYDILFKVVDSEEKAKQWIYDKAVELCSRLHQLTSYTFGDSAYTVHYSNQCESWTYYYECREVE